MTSTHSSSTPHSSSHASSHSNSGASLTGAGSHSVSYGKTLRYSVPDNTTSSSDLGTLKVLTAAINDIRVSWGQSKVSVPSSYSGLQSMVSALSFSQTRYQWGSKSISGHGSSSAGGKNDYSNSSGDTGSVHASTSNNVNNGGGHASTSVTSNSTSTHGSSGSDLNSSTTASISAPTWSTTPSTLLSNLNSSKLLLCNYMKSYGSKSGSISSVHTNGHTNHSQHSSY